jgi:hypothetical protein
VGRQEGGAGGTAELRVALAKYGLEVMAKEAEASGLSLNMAPQSKLEQDWNRKLRCF